MGWAKYFEDNISIYNNRIFMRDCVFNQPEIQESMRAMVKPNRRENVIVLRVEQHETNNTAVKYYSTKRCGLELRFPVYPEQALVNKLRLHGWWWSNKSNSWCNNDSEVNRRYVKESLRQWSPVLFRVAA